MVYCHRIVYCIVLSTFLKSSVQDTNILYDTKTATSDLDWALHPLYTGWEELSGLDVDGDTIRSYQVCNIEDKEQDNWARSPYIDAKSAQRVYIDIEFSVMKCPNCRETFNLYYYPSSSDVASSTFPPWRENPFIKIDTVAANERFDSTSLGPNSINKKTFVIGPLQRRGLYMAIQDQGACMSLMSMKVYYHYCPELTHNLAYFPKTAAGGLIASLVPVDGKCVSNALYTNTEAPKYHCNSNGEWKVATGTCHCRSGYSPQADNSACKACGFGYFKSKSGNHGCTRCPSHSSSRSVASTGCACAYGYHRAASEPIEYGCTRPPSAPNNLVALVNSTTIFLKWSPPSTTGNRVDIYYRVTCEQCDSAYKQCTPCSGALNFSPKDPSHVTRTNMKINHLEPFSSYMFTIEALNGVSDMSKRPAEYKRVKATTSANIPSPVENLSLIWKDESSISLRWSEPKHMNVQIVGYEVVVKMLSDLGSTPSGTPLQVIEVSTRNITIRGLSPAKTYSIKARAKSSSGFGKFCKPVLLTTNPQKPSKPAAVLGESTGIIAGVAAAVAIVFFVLLIALLWRQRNERLRQTQILSRRKSLDGESGAGLLSDGRFKDFIPGSRTQKTYVDYRDPHQGVKEIAFEVEVSQIKIDHVIGQGEFGEVCKGKLTQGKSCTVVAIKRLKHGASLIDQTNFLREACTLAQFSDPNIVQFKGVVTKNMPAMLITEFMDQGSLNKFLEKKKNQLSVSQLLTVLKGIASGMKYLSNMKYVHRDLAARNILVNSELVCKVSDFGLSRNLENDPHATYTTQGGKIAVRWTAPESILFRTFTSASDVWSYGIMMWEVMSYGEKPYWDMSNDDVIKNIQEGLRLPLPANCPNSLHDIMIACWHAEPAIRPTFNELFNRLNNFLEEPKLLIPKNDKSADLDTTSEISSSSSTIKPETIDKEGTIEEFLEAYHLGDYIELFKERGINNLEQFSNLTPNDLKSIGISRFFHIDQLNEGIKNLQRRLAR